MKSRLWIWATVIVVFAVVHSTGAWAENTYKVLHVFGQGSDGWAPESGLVLDRSGNLFGTTTAGGSGCSQYPGCGIVFELTPDEYGSWTETNIHNFTGTDGARPYAALVFDSRGSLYGTTYGNGIANQGTVFELTQSGGVWTENVLHIFTSGWDGGNPLGGVLLDNAGHLYGTTSAGGGDDGVVFSLGGQLIAGESVLRISRAH